MIMKKYLLLSLVLVMGLSMWAQEGSQNIGFNLGFASPVMRERLAASDTTLTGNNLYGIKAGLVYETTFIKGFGLQMGINYTIGAKAGKWETASNSTIHQTKKDYVYQQIEIPIDWQYKFEIAKETYLVLYTGPTIQYGISFNQKNFDKNINVLSGDIATTSVTTNRYRVSQDKDDKLDYGRLNITWGLGAGLQYQRYFLRAGYDFGIYNPYKDRFYNTSESDSSLGWYRKGRFDQWSIKLGIYFWQH